MMAAAGRDRRVRRRTSCSRVQCRAFRLLMQSELRVPGAVDCPDTNATPDVHFGLRQAVRLHAAR